ncbi:glycoside hydrolase family 17 protein [Hyaloscypha variabilis F]|uniref:glucan endo-1,3-beta-D-glucosidase n=1 Tax=Hyaloscypha variabilis (strain UAMH 11265 / GT02V1 / F) TaxID=1149755 RepID=A0A2J6SBB9_HYAVF|nr:glycoside hydrolase family 17 protein [Hyaloscypha variabilis F]
MLADRPTESCKTGPGVAQVKCKAQPDWEADFTTMKALSMRVYASSDCDTLVNAVPAVIAPDGQILVGKHGFDWMVVVSVGSEDLYRGDTAASTLAQQIYDLRGMLSTRANSAVIEACDFNTEAKGIDEAYNLFCESIQEVKDAVSSVNSVADVWVAETGWPTTGASENEAVAKVANAQKYRDTYALWDFSASPSFGVVDASFNALYDRTCSDSCEA